MFLKGLIAAALESSEPLHFLRLCNLELAYLNVKGCCKDWFLSKVVVKTGFSLHKPAMPMKAISVRQRTKTNLASLHGKVMGLLLHIISCMHLISLPCKLVCTYVFLVFHR